MSDHSDGHTPSGSRNHGHEPDRGHAHDDGRAPAAIMRAMGVTILFMAIEFAGGWFANSLALISDAAHMLTDVGAMSLSLFALWVARRPSTSKMSFGYYRAEILGALVSGLLIWLIAGGLVYEAILRMHSPPAVRGPVVFVVASVGLLANLAAMRMLHSARGENMNVRAAYIHMLSDSLGSIGAIVAGLVLTLTSWRLIDPIVTVSFSLLMVAGSWELIREAVSVLMESAPAGLDPDRVREDLQSLSGVREAHDLHIWAVSSGRLALSVHLIAEKSDVLSLANRMLEERYGIIHTTVQIEHPEVFRSERCYDCGTQGKVPGTQSTRSKTSTG